MKTEELIKLIKFRLTHNEDMRAKEEIIKRLEELEVLRFKLKEIKMKDYVDQSLIEELVKE